MELDVDRFKAQRPWLQISFWVALVPIVGLLLPDAREWLTRHHTDVAVAFSPFIAWLASNGYVRGKGVEAAGRATATSLITTMPTAIAAPAGESNPLPGEPPTSPIEPEDLDVTIADGDPV